MAWEISITAEGWQDIRDDLEQWDKEDLIEAICDNLFEMVFEMAGQDHAQRAFDAEKERLKALPHDILVDRAFELVEVYNTCENGGHGSKTTKALFSQVFLAALTTKSPR